MTKHLAWNENDSEDKKNKNQKDNDPWGRKNSGSNGDGLPDLDELFKKAQKWLLGKLPNDKGGNFNFQNKQGNSFIGLAAVIFVLIFGIMGFYIVEPGEQAVEYRFGKYIGMTGPGPHWILPGVYSKEVFNTSAVNQTKFDDDLITKEVNIVSATVAVQYRISNLENYLFKVKSPEDNLAEATKAAIRQVIAESTLEDVLSTRGNTKDSYMGSQIQALIKENLNLYQSGLDIIGVEILSVTPPQQVKEAFNDAIQAQEDEIRYQNEAEAYKNKVVPQAEGQAARILQDANGYAASTILAAEGGVARFNSILPEYKRAPQVTRKRLYISTIEEALVRTPKIIVDTKSNNTMLLPFDKFNLGNKNNIANNEIKILDNNNNNYNNLNQELKNEDQQSSNINNINNFRSISRSTTRDSR